jgi:hypothetical protein
MRRKLLPFVKHLLITGGHGDEDEIHNRLYSRDGQQHTWTCQRLPGSYHGSGCTLASALAGRLALGEQLQSAVRSALDYTWRTLRDAEQLGKGQYVPRRLPWISAPDTRPPMKLRGLYAITDSQLLAGRFLATSRRRWKAASACCSTATRATMPPACARPKR